ncbi:hypothetical protein PCA31118_05236 [Pandoraea captiosa]|uniref:Uncharacterized protein n=1 Tax=Pandoraea captiosa TaxID=2508302 RepID=A0A5E5AUL6_9BURK|nr:AlpA family phage regulatory protein [Pandoraea captiosa]VVE76572.1 hypothetical protein PCA31118_05236 [Pandoraea captiosa]
MMNAQQHTEHARAPKRAREDSPTLPAEGFVRLPQVLAVFPVSRTTWLRGVKEKRYPAPVQLSPSTVAWRVEDIRRLLNSIAANGDEIGGTFGGIEPDKT